MKRVLVMVLAMLTLLGAARAVTPATPVHFCGDYVYILLDDGGAEIVCWDGEEADLMVPGTLDGHPVVSVSECAFADCRTLRTVVLPEGVRAIGDEAFYKCVRLTSLEIPASVTAIGDAAAGMYRDDQKQADAPVKDFTVYGVTGSAAQQYADGVSIYIPRREDERTPWGAQSGIRREIAERNSHILRDHLAGMSAAELAERYFLSEKSIHRIIRNMKK